MKTGQNNPDDRFFLASLRDVVGTNLAFHGHGGCGYPTDLGKAQTYSRDEVQRIWNSAREFDLPLKADLVEQLSVFHVDCQHIPYQNTLVPGCTQYVAFAKSRWDGNDVYWLCEDGSFSADFSKAKIHRDTDENPELVWMPFEMADAKKRKTFCESLINRRTMIQGAGLITPAHIKKSGRAKKSAGKSRFNCPGCGKLSWQHNHHVFEGCQHCGHPADY